MKLSKILIVAALAVVFGTEVRAAAPLIYLSQTNNFTVNPSATLNWNQFDSSLGTLTGITFSVNAGISGSFTVTNSDPDSGLQVTDSNSRLRFAFSTGTGSPGNVFNEFINPIPTLPLSDSAGSPIAASSSQIFTINAGTQYADLTRDFFSASQSYFTGLGTVTSAVQQFLLVTSTGENFNLNSSLTKSSGTAVLTYVYQVPEPSSGTLLMLGIGGLIALRRARRHLV
jgi:hypothetical protein